MKTKKIKLNELFEIDGKLYIATVPTSPSSEINPHGQLIFALIKTKLQ